MCLGNSPHIFFFAPSHKRAKWPPKKFVGKITYEPLLGLYLNLVGLYPRYFLPLGPKGYCRPLPAPPPSPSKHSTPPGTFFPRSRSKI